MTQFSFESQLWLLLAAMILDWLIGDPDWLWRRLPHPVAWFGRAIGALDRTFNAEQPSANGLAFGARKLAGSAAILLLVILAAGAGIAVERALAALPYGIFGIPLVASIFLAGRSLYDHVDRVREALGERGLGPARQAVSMIVGRDPDSLDEAGICRAAIESTAESYADGVVAPALWFALLGLPGLFAYKMINTADSMIGHRTPRHAAFGWAAARLDDLVNLPASRLAGFLIAMAAPFVGTPIRTAFVTMLDNAGKHRSPNAGWPESAMAGALDLALGGPRRYGDEVVDDPFFNPAGRVEATPGDIGRALRVLKIALALGATLVAIIALWLRS